MGLPDATGQAPRPGTTPKRRPDARPTRVVLGLGTIAAMSIVTAGLARFPVTDTVDTAALDPGHTAEAHQEVIHRIRYVQLRRGERAPTGARVVSRPDPTPRVVVRTLPSERQTTTAPKRRTVARSRQSGG